MAKLIEAYLRFFDNQPYVIYGREAWSMANIGQYDTVKVFQNSAQNHFKKVKDTEKYCKIYEVSRIE